MKNNFPKNNEDIRLFIMLSGFTYRYVEEGVCVYVQYVYMSLYMYVYIGVFMEVRDNKLLFTPF